MIKTQIVSPMDKYNTELIKNTHPENWENPEPELRYNLVVIGAGTAGLIAAIGTAGLGGKAALIEKQLMGGDCLNTGCVPSKAIISSSRIVSDIMNAKKFGINIRNDDIDIDFPKIMERMRSIRAQISPHDSANRYKELGVDVFFGNGTFINRSTIGVDGKILKFKHAVIATGAHPFIPEIKGLKQSGFFTNETIFNITKKPESLGIIGGGPIGCELAQAFNRLGIKTVLFHNKEHILDREDSDAANVIQNTFIKEGIKLILNSDVVEVKTGNNKKTIYYKYNNKIESFELDEILVSSGRRPNIEKLNLEAAGVTYDLKTGIKINDKLQTSNPKIYASGDVCMKYKFTHAADAASKIVVQNSLFMGNKKLSSLSIPWCTYTDPEIAHTGLSEQEANAKGIKYNTYIKQFKDIDRAVIDNEENGFVKILTKKGSDRIIGAIVVTRNAGDMINEISVAMSSKKGLSSLYYVIHPYPTKAEAIRYAAGDIVKEKLTPFIKKLFIKWLKITG